MSSSENDEEYKIPDLNEKYFSEETYRELFHQESREELITSLYKMNDRNPSTLKENNQIKEEKIIRNKINVSDRTTDYKTTNKEDENNFYKNLGEEEKDFNNILKPGEQNPVLEPQIESQLFENLDINNSNQDIKPVIDCQSGDRIEGGQDFKSKMSIGSSPIFQLPKINNISSSSNLIIDNYKYVDLNSRNGLNSTLLNENNLHNKLNINQFQKSENNEGNNLLSRNNSLLNNDSFLEQEKSNEIWIKENSIKHDKKLKINFNSNYINQVILKCLNCFISIINTISLYEYNTHFSPINLEEIIPKNDEGYQNFLNKEIINLYLDILLGISLQDYLIVKNNIDFVIKKEKENQNIQYKLLNNIFYMKIKEILLIYVDGKPNLPYYYKYNLNVETFKTDKEYNDEQKIKIREEIHRLCGDISPIFNNEIHYKNEKDEDEDKKASFNFNMNNNNNITPIFFTNQEENKTEINIPKKLGRKTKNSKKGGKKGANSNLRADNIRRALIRRGTIIYKNYINTQFEQYDLNFIIEEIPVKDKIVNVDDQQDFLDKEMLTIFEICSHKNGNKNIEIINKVLELEKNDNSKRIKILNKLFHMTLREILRMYINDKSYILIKDKGEIIYYNLKGFATLKYDILDNYKEEEKYIIRKVINKLINKKVQIREKKEKKFKNINN